jgi:hypothetical protein
MACGVNVPGRNGQVLRGHRLGENGFLRDPADSRSDLEGFCGEADRVVVVRLSSPVSGPP